MDIALINSAMECAERYDHDLRRHTTENIVCSCGIKYCRQAEAKRELRNFFILQERIFNSLKFDELVKMKSEYLDHDVL